jgi:hypothetical protein
VAGRTAVRELIEVLGETYQSIDIRVATIREKEKWVCGVAVIRLSYEDPGTVRQRFLDVTRSYTEVGTKHFRIVFDVRPFADWQIVCDECGAGLLHIGDIDVHLEQGINVPELASEIRQDPSGVRPVDCISWPGVFVSVGRSAAGLGEEPLIREIGPLGYSFPLEAVNELCGVNVTHGQNPGAEFYLSAPVFCQLENVVLRPSDKRLEATIRKHNAISGLSVALILRGQTFAMNESASYRRAVTRFAVVEEAGTLQKLLAEASELPQIPLDKWVEVKLVHSKLGEIRQFIQTADNFIPAVERNVLREALKCFCSEQELSRLLVQPYERKSATLKTSAAFELHVCWLLSLCGLSTILLGEYEHVFATQTNIPRGSIDVLAARTHGNTLLLVSCTLGPPNEQDFGNLLNMKGILERAAFEGTSVGVLPVLFTGAHGQPPWRSFDGGLWGIPIMDADRIEILLKGIAKGAEKQFFEFLQNPNAFDLQEPYSL